MGEGVAQMGWERRGSGMYYCRKQREGRRVVSEYIGAGPLAEAMATLDEAERAEREFARAAEWAEREAFDARDKPVADLVKLARLVTRAVLLDTGHHTHKGQWRKARDDKHKRDCPRKRPEGRDG